MHLHLMIRQEIISVHISVCSRVLKVPFSQLLSNLFLEQLVITGVDGGKAANALLQSNAIFKDMHLADGDQQSRNAILSELAVASGTGDVRIFVSDGVAAK